MLYSASPLKLALPGLLKFVRNRVEEKQRQLLQFLQTTFSLERAMKRIRTAMASTISLARAI